MFRAINVPKTKISFKDLLDSPELKNKVSVIKNIDEFSEHDGIEVIKNKMAYFNFCFII